MHCRKLFEYFLFFPPSKLKLKKLSSKLQGKNILITGASRGIGASLTYIFAKTGANLFLVARNKKRLEAIQKVLTKKGTNVQIFSCDFFDIKQVEVLTEELIKIQGGINIFISNAGKSIKRSFFDSLDRFYDFEKTMSINFFAPVKLILFLYAQNADKLGTIINVSSMSALIFPPAKWAAYQSSKSAFDQWFRSVGAELQTKNIKTISVYFPLVRTSMIFPSKKYRNKPALSSKQAAMIISNSIIQNKRHYKPWWSIFAEIASVLFSRYLEKFSTKI